MGFVMAVSFTRYGRFYYLDPAGYRPKVGDRVLVPADDGTEVAECVWAPQYTSDGRVVAHDVPRDGVVVRLVASGQARRCSRAVVCAPCKAYDSSRSDPQGASSSDA